MEVVIACGGPSSEYDVSLSTARQIVKNIDKKHKVKLLLIGKDYKSVIFNPSGREITFAKPHIDLGDCLKKISRNSIIFNAMHGEFGEDGVFQSILDGFGLKYTGSCAQSSALCMNKYASYQVLKDIEVKIPKIYAIGKILSVNYSNFKYPVIVKPNSLGSSVGIKVVSNIGEFRTVIDELKKTFSGIDFIFQEYLENTVEISCGCLENTNGIILRLPPVEIVPVASSFYDYESKYSKGGSKHYIPPISIDKRLQDRLSKITSKIHKKLGCKTYSRSDFLLNNGIIYYLETNTLPGMTETSLLPQEAEYIGLGYRKLLDFILENS